MAERIVQEESLLTVADAIREKTGSTEGLAFPEGFVEAINGISGGGGGGSTALVSPKDVNFYDYDGTLVASYTLTEAQALTALPNGPTHEGLTFQGWNWTLNKVKALTRPMNVGAMYITDDRKTRLHIRIPAEGRMNVPLYISQTVANGVSIDWGDGSAPETLAGTGDVNTTHTYADVGDFTISLTVADGCELGLGYNYSSYCIMGSTGNNGRVYCNMLQSVYVGGNVTSIRAYAFCQCSSLASIIIPDSVTSIGTYAFKFCYSLASITIPDGVASIENSVFDNCRSLASIIIPDGATSIRDSAFFNCHSLANVTIPDNMTSIGAHALSNCFSLASITIPDGMTSIEDSAFYNCYGMAEYHLKPVTPPTLSSINAFSSIPSDCLIYVPAGSLNAYQTATNWSNYASYMREEPV